MFMKEYIISADVLSLIFMSIILCSVLINSKNRKTFTKMFIAILIVIIIAIITDAASYIADGRTEYDSLLSVLNLLSYVFAIVVIDLYSIYMVSIIRERVYISYKFIIPVIVLSVFNLIILVAGTLNGKLFQIVEHEYCAGEWDAFAYVLTVVYLVYLCFVLFKYHTKLSRSFVLGLGAYLVFPLLLSICVINFDLPDFTYASIAISLLIVYVTIQTKTIAEVQLREKILNEVSYIDSLTGLKNRRAYDEFLQNDDQNKKKGIAFFDLNSLKYTNDTYGHAAGDRLIKSFADLLSESFSDGEVFRISGDEFVVSLYYIGGDEMKSRMQEFRKVIQAHSRIASFGFVYCESGNALKMVREAEKNMYKDKAIYYKDTGKDRRS